MLEINDIHFAHAGRGMLFEGLHFSAHPGKVLALIGRNGAGKSTLLRLLNGLSKVSRGQIRLDGVPLEAQRPDQLADRIGTLFQVPEQQIFHASVRAEVSYGLPSTISLSERQSRLDTALRRTGLEERAQHHPLDLDHASRRMVALACLLARAPRVLLLDEPQRGLDSHAAQRMSRLIEEERQRGAIQILICHDMEFVARHADDVLALYPGGYINTDALSFFSSDELITRAGVTQPLSVAISQRLGLPMHVRLEDTLQEWAGTAGA